MTVRQYAAWRGTTAETVRRWIRTGVIRHTVDRRHTGARAPYDVLVPVDEAEQIVAGTA